MEIADLGSDVLIPDFVLETGQEIAGGRSRRMLLYQTFYSEFIIRMLADNTEIQEFLTYVVPVDAILASVSIYYSEALRAKELIDADPDEPGDQIPDEYFNRGYKSYKRFTKLLFAQYIKDYFKKGS
jgi:hypothetical protein